MIKIQTTQTRHGAFRAKQQWTSHKKNRWFYSSKMCAPQPNNTSFVLYSIPRFFRCWLVCVATFSTNLRLMVTILVITCVSAFVCWMIVVHVDFNSIFFGKLLGFFDVFIQSCLKVYYICNTFKNSSRIVVCAQALIY